MATAMGAPTNPHLNCWRWTLADMTCMGQAVCKSRAYPDEEPIHESIQWGTDEQNV